MKLSRLTRRNLITACITGLVAGFLIPVRKNAQGHEFSGYENSKGVLVDLTRCIGCRSCEAACNHEHDLPDPGLPFNDMSIYDLRDHGQKRRPDEKSFTVVNRYQAGSSTHPLYRKVQCNHCQEPACLTSCFVNAYSKTAEGAVVYNPNVCVGCRTCMIACPFSIPAFLYSSAFKPQIMKCNFCYDTRLQQGKVPACVEACPSDALTFGERDTLIKVARQRFKQKKGRYTNYIYGEHEAGGTSWLYISGTPFAAAGFDEDIPKQPIINYVKDFLAVVPMVLTIWPGLFAGIHLLVKRRASATSDLNNRPES